MEPTKISDIPTLELIGDMCASYYSYKIFTREKNIGTAICDEGLPIQERLDGEKRLYTQISTELLRRTGDLE